MRFQTTAESPSESFFSQHNRVLHLSNNARVKSLTIFLVLLGVPMFMVWWQTYDSPLSSAKLRHNEEGELMEENHSEILPAVSDAEQEQKDDLKLIWLMSFPNSGTSYTLRLVQSATQKAIATNYGAEFTSPPDANVPVYPDSLEEGPFWKAQDNNTHPLPTKYMLTKTHCGSRCVTCNQRKYISTLDQFMRDCTRGSGFMDGEWRETHYEPPPTNKRLAKIIHIIRNPFDNIVSRFHLSHKKRSKEPQKYKNFLEKYPSNSTGFARWCQDLDQDYGSPFNPRKVHVGSLSCQGEWFKYVQWHVLALGVIEKSQLPSLTVHYEDYEAPKWNSTMKTILDFMEMPIEGHPRPFQSHPPYDYYTEQQRREARDLVRRMASDKVWALLKHYFD